MLSLAFLPLTLAPSKASSSPRSTKVRRAGAWAFAIGHVNWMKGNSKVDRLEDQKPGAGRPAHSLRRAKMSRWLGLGSRWICQDM